MVKIKVDPFLIKQHGARKHGRLLLFRYSLTMNMYDNKCVEQCNNPLAKERWDCKILKYIKGYTIYM